MKIKKLISVVTTFVLTFLIFCEIKPLNKNDTVNIIVTASESAIRGDADGNGKLNIRDAAAIAISCAKGTKDKLPACADYNYDGARNIRDAAAIAINLAGRYSSKTQINFRFASKTDGIKLKLENEAYFNSLTQQNLNYRMKQENTTAEQFRKFAGEQILDFSTSQKALLFEVVSEIQREINKNGYELPLKDELIFIKTTAKDEIGAAGYTLKNNQIYLSNSFISNSGKNFIKRVVVHELFHCLSRSDPKFRKDMYKFIGFSIADKEPEFPAEIKDMLAANPDVEKYDSYATFTINGKKRACYLIWLINKPFSTPADDFQLRSSSVLVPVDNLTETYNLSDASDFWEVVGKNTDYVIAAEECIADNFSFAILDGTKTKYESPEIIKNIVAYLK